MFSQTILPSRKACSKKYSSHIINIKTVSINWELCALFHLIILTMPWNRGYFYLQVTGNKSEHREIKNLAHDQLLRLVWKLRFPPPRFTNSMLLLGGVLGGTSSKEPTCQCRRHKRGRFDAWVGKMPWRRKWQPTPEFLPGESCGQRGLLQATVHGVTKSQTWLKRQHTCMHMLLLDILIPVCLTMCSLFFWETFQSNNSFLHSKIPRWCGLWDVFHSLQGNGACMLSSLSCVQLFATPWTIPGQTLLSVGFPRQEDWNGLPFPSPGDLPNPGIKPVPFMSPTLTGRCFTAEQLEASDLGKQPFNFENFTHSIMEPLIWSLHLKISISSYSVFFMELLLWGDWTLWINI